MYHFGGQHGDFCSVLGSQQRASVNLTLGGYNSTVLPFVITPLKIGEIEIKVRVVDINDDHETDSIVKKILVKVRG